MSAFLSVSLVVLLITMAAGLVRVARGPTEADRVLASLLLGTTGVAILLVLSLVMSMPAAVDVALMFAVLSAIIGIAFALRGRVAASESEKDLE